MTGKIPGRAGRLAAAILAAVAVLAVMAGTAGAVKLYNNIPKKAAALPAMGFECCQTKQFGGAVEFTQAPSKKNSVTFTVTIGMDSYGCEKGSWTGTPECITSPGATFKWPITLRINDLGPGNSVGELIAEEKKEFDMSYRPSQNNTYCTGPEKGAWYDSRTHECYIDNFFTISYTLTVPRLEKEAIISVAYPTTTYGEPPAGEQPCDKTKNGSETYDDCPYDSLNVAVNAIYEKVGPGEDYEALPTEPSKGSDPLPEEVFLNSESSYYYCGNPSPGAFAASGMKEGKGCWKYEQPAIEVQRP
jgi:hypothetical protein